MIIVGEMRWKAAIKLGLAEVPVHRAVMPAEKVRAYRIADNRTGEIAIWDTAMLESELQTLHAGGLNPAILGFDVDELQRLLGGDLRPGLTDPDSIPAPTDEPIALALAPDRGPRRHRAAT